MAPRSCCPGPGTALPHADRLLPALCPVNLPSSPSCLARCPFTTHAALPAAHSGTTPRLREEARASCPREPGLKQKLATSFPKEAQSFKTTGKATAPQEQPLSCIDMSPLFIPEQGPTFEQETGPHGTQCPCSSPCPTVHMLVVLVTRLAREWTALMALYDLAEPPGRTQSVLFMAMAVTREIQDGGGGPLQGPQVRAQGLVIIREFGQPLGNPCLAGWWGGSRSYLREQEGCRAPWHRGRSLPMAVEAAVVFTECGIYSLCPRPGIF